MTFTSHDEYLESNNSEKIVLAHVHGTKRLYNFVTDTGIVSRTTSNFVNTVKHVDVSTEVITELTKVSSIGAVTDNTKFFFDPPTSKLYLFEFVTTNDEIIVEFRLFFSTIPIILAWDLSDDSSDPVEYQAKIEKAPEFKSQMSQGKKGINLVGKGVLVLSNNDGALDDIYDDLFFDNGDISVYSTHRDLDPTDAQIIFKGTITGRSFSRDKVTYIASDTNFKLDTNVRAFKYGISVRQADKNVYKRIIYGRADNVICQSLDQYALSGNNNLTGTIAGTSAGTILTGTGTLFRSELSEGDIIKISGVKVCTVESVKSDTLIRTSAISASFDTSSTGQGESDPKIQYNSNNREFQVAGHAIKKYSTTVTSSATTSRFIVGDTEGFEVGDSITVDGDERIIQTVSLSTSSITVTIPIVPAPSASDVVTKLEVFNVRHGSNEILISNSDVTLDNTDNSHTKFTLSSNAEFNSTLPVRSIDNFLFRNGSNIVWLGTPASYTITTIAHTIGSPGTLDQDFFIIEDIDAVKWAFWYGDTGTSAPTETEFTDLDGSGRQIKITFSVNKTDEEVATETVIEMQKNIDFFQIRSASNVITLDSTIAQNILIPTAETSGFTIGTISTGIAPTSIIPSVITPRDFVRVIGDSVNEYSVLSVTGTSIILREPFGQTTTTNELEYRDIEYIGDTTKVYVNTFGKTKDGTKTGVLISTGPEVVEDTLLSIGFTASDLDTASFTDSSVRSPALISIMSPENARGTPQTVKSFIDSINKTLFGSLFLTRDLLLGYDILDVDADIATLRTITEADLVGNSWKIGSESFDLVKKVTAKFNFIDFNPDTLSSSNSEVDYTNPFTTKYLNNTNTSERKLYLKNEVEAQEAVERETFINSFSNAKIKLTGSLSLSRFQMGERVILDFIRAYRPMGSVGTKRIGIITLIKTTGEKTNLEVEDIGGIYMRAARISDNSTPEYDSATEDDIIKNSFIVAEDGIITSDERTFSTNLIG